MPPESKSAILLLRSHTDLSRASAELAEYLSLIRTRSTARECMALQGIWIDENCPAELPSPLETADTTDMPKALRVIETTGVYGIWMLCRLEAPASTVSRVDILTDLLSCYSVTESPAPGARFIPVFSNDTQDAQMNIELQQIDACHPGMTSPAILQDTNGALILQTRPEGMRA